ncbi:MAG: SMEK domain-containing protein [Proteocatella sp.]
MNRESYLKDINRYLSVLRYEVEHNNLINLYDINIISENFYNQLLNMIYGYKLQNINIVEKNATAIDLGDLENRIAVQVTSDNTSGKIKKTIRKFLENNHNEKYDRLIMLLITSKQKYTTAFNTDCKFVFDISKDIIDVEDIIKELNGKETGVLKDIANFLKNELSSEIEDCNNQTIDINQIQERKINYLENLKHVYIKEVKSIFLDREFKVDKTNIDIDEIVKSDQNFLILGEPGAGKTYCINRIIHEISNSNNLEIIPVYIKLSGYGYSYNTVEDRIFSILSKYLIVEDKNDVDTLLRTGKLILLLDGLDEVRDEYYEDCLSELKDKMNYNPLNKYIISCRDNMYFNELDNFLKKVELQDLTTEQISEYLKTFCGINFFDITANQYELFKNPLLLNIAIEVINENEGIIPLNRSKMFNKYIEYLCRTWGKVKGLIRKQELSYIEVILFLSKIAFNQFDKPYLSLIDIQSLIKKEFNSKNINDICNQILNIGILKYKSESEIYFVHKTFKEYLAGIFVVGVAEEKRELNILERIINKKQYHEVIIFASGLFNNWEIQNEFLDFILERNFPLYVECIKGKNDMNDYLLTIDIDDYSNLYMNILVNSYEKIINKYFPQIKHLFVPFNGCRDKYDHTEIAIIGQLSEDRRNIYYSYISKDKDEKKVLKALPEKIKNYHVDKQSTRYQIHSIDLELSNLMADSA